MPVLEVREEIPQEITDRRIHAATYLALNKKLTEDIANTKKLPMVVIWIDVTNCYNRVVHLFTSLSVQYFRLDATYLLVLFRIF